MLRTTINSAPKLFFSPLLAKTTAHSYFLNVYPEISKHASENNLSEKLLKNVASITDEQFSISNKPNELEFYKSVYNISLESLAALHFESMIKLVESDPSLLIEIMQFPILVPGGQPHTRAQIIADRSLVYLNESQTMKLFKSNDPTFVDNLPTGTAAQRTARFASFTELSNSLSPNIMTPFRTLNAVQLLTDVERHRARDTTTVTQSYMAKRTTVKNEANAIAISEMGSLDTTLTANLQVEWIKSRLSASQKQSAKDNFAKSQSLFEISRKNNSDQNDKITASLSLMFPELKSFPKAYEHYTKKEYHLIIPELNIYFCRLANPQMDSFFGAYAAIAYNSSMSATNTIR